MYDRLYRRTAPVLLLLAAGALHLTRHWWRVEDSLPPDSRPAAWAEPLTLPGVANLHRVSPDLYRGEQPTEEGRRELEKLGIRTVVNLRSFHSDRALLGTSALNYEHMTMKAWHPEDKEIIRFLKIVSEPGMTPVFVHCQHGADRTGTMCAVYRMAIQGWSREEAIAEMTRGGYGFHSTWTNLIDYLRQLDLEVLCKAAGIASPNST